QEPWNDQSRTHGPTNRGLGVPPERNLFERARARRPSHKKTQPRSSLLRLRHRLCRLIDDVPRRQPSLAHEPAGAVYHLVSLERRARVLLVGLHVIVTEQTV